MIVGYILVLIAIIDVVVGLRLVFRYQRSKSSILYGLVSFGIGLYVAINGLGYAGVIVGNPVVRYGWVGATIATVCFLGFSFSWPIPRKKNDALLPLILWPAIIFIPAFMFTNLLVKDNGALKYTDGYNRANGDFLLFFYLFFVVYWVWSLINLWTLRKQSEGIHYWQLSTVFFGTLASLLLASTFDIILPGIGVGEIGYIGPLSTSIWLGFSGFVLLKTA